ncbi:hypothetical protein FRB97_001104 [Tulasnella sp. 331]|nr:hypothetical protein FRB97_001104 [Tulasnella sp. 331]
MTDRFALPTGSGIDPTACDPSKQQYCGGTWASITANLDYIQEMGFTAIWISPVNQNIPGPTAYGYPYHGYWIADITQLNSQFGTEADLIALSDELHRRDMYLMFDIVVNNVASTSLPIDYSQYMFQNATDYHPYCVVDYSNVTSAQQCWLGDTNVYLPDVNTENAAVVSQYNSWIAEFVVKFKVDGLRIDAAKHVRPSFWGPFCQAAGVFCIGEVFGDPVPYTATYQGLGTLDSVLNFPQYSALTEAFAIPGPQNMSGLVDLFNQARNPQTGFSDVTVLGNFMENQDLPRWANISVDPQSEFNALTFSFMSDGIPIIYQGQEQRFHGAADPMNREPLWSSAYANTTTMQYIQALNKIRSVLVATSDWASQPAQIISNTASTVFLAKGFVLSVMTNIGSPPANISAHMTATGFSTGEVMIEMISCQQVIIGSQGSINIDYQKGGRAAILIPEHYLRGTPLCAATQAASYQGSTVEAATRANGAMANSLRQSTTLLSAGTALFVGALLCISLA